MDSKIASTNRSLFLLFVIQLLIIFSCKQCKALAIPPKQGQKGPCVLQTHDLMDPLRMNGPEITASEFDNNFGVPFSPLSMGGIQFRYRFISKMRIECSNIEGNIPKFEGSYDSLPSYGYAVPGYINTMEAADMMLICKDCKVPKLSTNTTDNLRTKSKFMYIDFADSEMTEINPYAFDEFPQLCSLVLDDNSLTSLPQYLFDHQLFQNTLQLSIQNNSFEKISNAFCGVKEFDFLNLQNNKIKSMYIDCKVKINNLNMSKNAINVLDLDWLDNYDKLNLLDLSFNKLQQFVNVEKSNLDSLKYLLINDNMLSKIGRRYFRRFTTLQYLNIRRNIITVIDSEAFKDLKSLLTLDLSTNYISDIPFGIFRDLEMLKELNLAGNELKQLTMQTFAGLTELKYLNLSSNYLKQIASTDLLQIKQLQAIDLSNNRLQQLDAKAIMNQHSITWMAIKNNFWNCRQLLHILQYTRGQNCNIKRGTLFDVPNIHGIACSPKNQTLSPQIDFNGFLSTLSDEKEMELILSKLDSIPVDETSELELLVSKIKSLVLLITVVYMVDFIFQWLFRLYQARHTVTMPISTLK